MHEVSLQLNQKMIYCTDIIIVLIFHKRWQFVVQTYRRKCMENKNMGDRIEIWKLMLLKPVENMCEVDSISKDWFYNSK